MPKKNAAKGNTSKGSKKDAGGDSKSKEKKGGSSSVKVRHILCEKHSKSMEA